MPVIKPKSKPRATEPSDRSGALPLAKLLKLFQLIAFLKAGRWSIKHLVARLGSSKSSMYRYLELLTEAGFCVEKDFHDRYFIVTTDDDPLAASFTVEEINMLRPLLQSQQAHPLMASVLKKISLHSELDSMPQLFLKAHLSTLVQQLNEAIQARHQVILKNYHSANSDSVGDRVIEPIHFGDNFTSIIALDTQSLTCKQFKLDRIGAIEEMRTPFQYTALHQHKPGDVFGIAGQPISTVTLRLSARAYLLLREEFPLAMAYLKQTDASHYTFSGPVANYQGIGRFVLGLLNEIEIIDPPEFSEHIHAKVMAFVMKEQI